MGSTRGKFWDSVRKVRHHFRKKERRKAEPKALQLSKKPVTETLGAPLPTAAVGRDLFAAGRSAATAVPAEMIGGAPQDATACTLFRGVRKVVSIHDSS